MPKRQLDNHLLDKLVAKTGKSRQYLREQISRKAGKLGVSSLAAQLIWAKQLSIGITHALNRALPEVREEVRSAHLAPAVRREDGIIASKAPAKKKEQAITGATID